MTEQFVPFDQSDAWIAAAAAVYTATYGGNVERISTFVREQTQRPDFRGLLAVTQEQQVIGLGFGTRSDVGQWWHDLVSQHLSAQHPALQDAWVLVELVLLPEHRGHGWGSELLDALLHLQQQPRAVLSADTGNTRARHFYAQRGWHQLHAGIPFPNQKTYAILGRELAALFAP